MFIPDEIVDRIMLIPAPHDEELRDVVAWNHSANGILDVKFAYVSLIPDLSDNRERIWKKIWRWDGLPQVKTFIWLLFHYRISTRWLYG